MTNYRELKSIKVTHTTTEGEVLVSFISFNRFETSFVKERWSGERRTGKTTTMFGTVHTKTTVTNPYDGSKSVRTFEFPNSIEEARQLHEEYELNHGEKKDNNWKREALTSKIVKVLNNIFPPQPLLAEKGSFTTWIAECIENGCNKEYLTVIDNDIEDALELLSITNGKLLTCEFKNGCWYAKYLNGKRFKAYQSEI